VAAKNPANETYVRRRRASAITPIPTNVALAGSGTAWICREKSAVNESAGEPSLSVDEAESV
jgi:hypothetical protein